MIHLSKRLQAVVENIHGNVLADIGCDHGYVCIQAIQSNIVNKAYACDIARGPLDNARKTIEKEGLTQSITCIEMNGMEHLPDDVDTIVIAGMGSTLMIQIIDSSIDLIKKGTQLVCSPQKDIETFRKFLSCKGFVIQKEKVIYEDNHYYTIFDLIYTEESYTLTDTELYYGKNVEVNDEYVDYIYHEKSKWNKIYQQLPDSKKESIETRIKVLNNIEL